MWLMEINGLNTNLEISPDVTVDQLKEKVKNLKNYPNGFTMACGGQIMKSGQVLNDYISGSNLTVNINATLAGGN